MDQFEIWTCPWRYYMTIEMPLNWTVSHCWHIHRISRDELWVFIAVSHWKGLRLDHFNSMLIEWQGLVSQCNIRNQCVHTTFYNELLVFIHFDTKDVKPLPFWNYYKSLRFLNSRIYNIAITSRYWNTNTRKNKLRM